ncbi:MAG: Cys-Gln thioester bond-forming surface protein, partial [Actinocatenispora sp.]
MLSFVRKRRRAGLGLVLGAAVAAASVATFTAPAQADPANPGTVHGTFTSDVVDGYNVKLANNDGQVSTALFKLSVQGGGDLAAYCIDLHTGTRIGNQYDESDWSTTNVGDGLAKVNWILHNSYPSVQNPAEIGKGVQGADKHAMPSAALTTREAVTATQAAIWHYSDGATLKESNHGDDQARWDRIYGLYDMLTDDAINVGEESEPAPTIALGDGHNVTGSADKPIGPIAVHTSADSVQLSLNGAPEGAKILVKHNGQTAEGTTAVNGDELFVKVPDGAETGSTSITATVSGQVATGRVFVGNPADSIQKLILAGSGSVSASSSAQVTWAARQLPVLTATSENICVPAGKSGDSGVQVTVANTGKASGDVTVTNGDFTKTVTVEAGASQTVDVPVANGKDYAIKVASGDYNQEFTGTLSCGVASPSASPSPSSEATGGLPVTGTSLPIIVGSGIVLLVAGGALLFVLRRRRN